MRYVIYFVFIIFLVSNDNLKYNIKPIKVATNTYFVEGSYDYFSQKNGGDIANVAFIVTDNGVIIIDTGSSLKYGIALKEQIAKITPNKITHIINTHHHPDHFLGNLAFKDAKIWSTEATANHIKEFGDDYVVALSQLIFDWMLGTEVKAPTNILKKQYINFDGYELEFLYLKGHTNSDIAIYDKKTKTLFASDLVFYQRAAAMPHAQISDWLNSLDILQNINYTFIIPGHGPVSTTKEPIKQTKDYLVFMDNAMKEGIDKAYSMYEILESADKSKFKNIHLLEEEMQRSIMQLYPKYEDLVIETQ